MLCCSRIFFHHFLDFTFLQGLSTVMLSFTTGFSWMLLLRVVNGAMLASLKPLCVGLVADTTSETSRGRIYGPSLAVFFHVFIDFGVLFLFFFPKVG